MPAERKKRGQQKSEGGGNAILLKVTLRSKDRIRKKTGSTHDALKKRDGIVFSGSENRLLFFCLSFFERKKELYFEG